MQVAKNTFTDGLVMDLSPENTPNTCLTNALNATYVTMNGNELQLQNDMGNAKFGAYLPQGYVPLGTTQLGGIIYVISYNPTNGKTQIGSFPSPQITFDSTKDIESTTIELNYFENNLQYKKVYDDFTLQPGDKFIFYFPANLADLTTYLYNEELFNTTTISLEQATAITSFIKFAIGAISQEGKLIYLNNLRHLYLEKDEVTEQDYNIYNSTVSGNLAIILTKVFCEDTNLQVLATAVNDDIFRLQFIYTLKSHDKFIPSVIKGNLNNSDLSIYYDENNLDNNNIKWLRNNERTMYQIVYNNTFNKNKFNDTMSLKLAAYKQINDLNIRLSYDLQQVVDLTKLGTGTIQLTKYKYIIDSNGVTINFSYNAFLNLNETLDTVIVDLYESNNSIPIYTTSFSGATINNPMVSIPYSDNFQANRLYVVKFSFNFKHVSLLEANEDTHSEYVTRWLITENNIFNDTQQDYHGNTTINYWIKSIKSQLTLGKDIVSTQYAGMFGLIEQGYINISEEHTFNNAQLTTTLELDSNVKNLKCNSINTGSSIETGELIENNSDNTNVFICNNMTATNIQPLHLTLTYQIKGSRTTPMHKSDINVAYQIKDINTTKYQTMSIYKFNAGPSDKRYGLAENVFNQNTNNITFVHIHADGVYHDGHFEIRDPNDPAAPEERYKDVYGIMLTGPTINDTRLISFKDFTQKDAEILFTILTRQLYQYKKSQELKYYTIASDYSILHGDLETVYKQINFESANLSLLINGQDINKIMNEFICENKPAPIKFTYIQDKTYISEFSKQVPQLPEAYIDSHLSLDSQKYESVLIANKNIYTLDGTNNYIDQKLYITNMPPEYGQLTLFMEDPVRVDNYIIKADFSFSEDGFLIAHQHQTPSFFNYWYTEEGKKKKIELCEWDYNNAITKVTN